MRVEKQSTAGAAPAVASSVQLTRALHDNPVGFALIDQHYRFVWTNPAFRNLLGYGGEELEQRTLLDTTRSQHIDSVARPLFNTAQPTESFSSRHTQFIRSDGSTLNGQIQIPIAFQLDESVLAMGMVSASRALDPEAILIEQLQRSAAVGQASEGIAHELRNSMGALRVIADTFRADPTPDSQRLDLLDQGIDTMLDLVNSVVAFGEPDESQAVTTALGTLLADSQALIRLVLPPRSRLEITSTSAEAAVDLSRREFHQILLNLVLNARDATSPDGTISIETEALAHSVSLTVTDDGTGMDEETRGKIFDRYYSTKGGHGSGLGLAICRQIIERHGGRLTVRTELGEGASFTVTLPRAA